VSAAAWFVAGWISGSCFIFAGVWLGYRMGLDVPSGEALAVPFGYQDTTDFLLASDALVSTSNVVAMRRRS
jgi:hypothetical protein